MTSRISQSVQKKIGTNELENIYPITVIEAVEGLVEELEEIKSNTGSTNVSWDEIEGKPESMPANGGNSDTVGGFAPSAFLNKNTGGDVTGTLTVSPNTKNGVSIQARNGSIYTNQSLQLQNMEGTGVDVANMWFDTRDASHKTVQLSNVDEISLDGNMVYHEGNLPDIDGGDADTLGGMTNTEFVRMPSRRMNIEDLNNANYPTSYRSTVAVGTELGLPVSQWYHIDYFRHLDNNGYGLQIAYPLNHDSAVMMRRATNEVYGAWCTFYTSNYKPNASDVGALPTTGGAISGTITRLGLGDNNVDIMHFGHTAGQASWKLGYKGSTTTTQGNEFLIQSDYGHDRSYQFDHEGNLEWVDGSTRQKFYSEKNKPTAQEIGITSSTTHLVYGLNTINVDTTRGNWTVDISVTTSGTVPESWVTVVQTDGGHFINQMAYKCDSSSDTNRGGGAIWKRNKYSGNAWSAWTRQSPYISTSAPATSSGVHGEMWFKYS